MHLFAKHNCLPDRGGTGSNNEGHIAEASSIESFSDRSDCQGTLLMRKVHRFPVRPLDDKTGNSGSSESTIGISLSQQEDDATRHYLTAWAASARRSRSCFLSLVKMVIVGQ